MAKHWRKNHSVQEPAIIPGLPLSRIKLILENSPGRAHRTIGMKITGLGRPTAQKSLFTKRPGADNLLEDVKQLDFRLAAQLYGLKEVEPWSRIPERRYALIR